MVGTHRELRPEQQAYEAALPDVISEHDGQYVVIQGTTLRRFFESYEAAVNWAYDQFGLEPFFVKLVSAESAVAHFTRDLGPCR
jgi:hypothetical protein